MNRDMNRDMNKEDNKLHFEFFNWLGLEQWKKSPINKLSVCYGDYRQILEYEFLCELVKKDNIHE
jgi:hypothetical protein